MKLFKQTDQWNCSIKLETKSWTVFFMYFSYVKQICLAVWLNKTECDKSNNIPFGFVSILLSSSGVISKGMLLSEF